jgi:transcriptional regulator GlxA family with amidase domain
MKIHLAEPLQVPRLAAVVNLSASHYASLFKRMTGYPPVDYLIRLRMQRAVQLLNTTQLSVKEIAVRVGYPDQFYFSRAFKQIHEHSPSEHRLRHRA